jgi:hypothetical protein
MRNGVLLLLTAGVLACQRPNPGYHPNGIGGTGGPADSGIAGSGGDTGAAGNTGAAGGTGTGGTMDPAGTGGSSGGTGAIGGTGGAIGGTGGAIGGTGGAIGGTGGAGGGGRSGGAGGAGGGGRGGGAGGAGLCASDQDCISGVGPPCGMFQCRTGRCVVVCPNCADTDGDGYGIGTGCAGADCNDSDQLVTTSGSRSCYSGQMGTSGVGVCRAGTQTCAAGVWSSPCNGEVLPLLAEACNGEDDDCNGGVDDDLPAIVCGIGACAHQAASCSGGRPVACLPLAAPATTDGCDGVDNDCDGIVDEDCSTVTCVRVAPSGDDNGADGGEKPFRNIQSAINWAAMPDHGRRICVAGGATCSDRFTYLSPDGAQALMMADGISVYGNYESTTWTRCSLTPAQVVSPGPNVTIQTQTATGVQFPSTVRTPTTLDGFAIARMRGDALPSTAAVTVDGAKQVTLSSLVIADAANAVASWGINLVNGAEALITRSIVASGAGTQEAIAIRSVGALPTIRESCSSIDPTSGRCATTACTGLGLRGRNTASGSSAGVGMVVLLKDSPGAVVERNLICGGPAGELSGVRIVGPAGGTVVRGNSIFGQGGAAESHGVWIEGCGDAAPWIVDNETILGDGLANASVSAVRAMGACHPVIDGNIRLMAGGEAATARAVGVVCAASASSASRCAVVGNKLIQGAPSNRLTQSIGVACEAGACARVAGNVINGNNGGDAVGVLVSGGGPLVERNNITGGCGSRSTAGLLADNSAGRVENNQVRGAVCASNLTTPQAVGVRVHVVAGGNEVEVHSNTVDAGGTGTCSGAAAVLGTTATANTALRKGIFRNNILRVGACSTVRYGFWESSPPVEPRIFENNDLDPTGSPTALYLDANATALTTEAAVNALTGTVASGNISADPMFVAPPSDLRLGAGSRCADTGTATGAPARDYAGRMRDSKPDIGAHER